MPGSDFLNQGLSLLLPLCPPRPARAACTLPTLLLAAAAAAPHPIAQLNPTGPFETPLFCVSHDRIAAAAAAATAAARACAARACGIIITIAIASAAAAVVAAVAVLPTRVRQRPRL
jgi:hypothetical protein